MVKLRFMANYILTLPFVKNKKVRNKPRTVNKVENIKSEISLLTRII